MSQRSSSRCQDRRGPFLSRLRHRIDVAQGRGRSKSALRRASQLVPLRNCAAPYMLTFDFHGQFNFRPRFKRVTQHRRKGEDTSKYQDLFFPFRNTTDYRFKQILDTMEAFVQGGRRTSPSLGMFRRLAPTLSSIIARNRRA